MDDETYRLRLAEIEAAYADAIKRALCRRQSSGPFANVFDRNPDLIYWTASAIDAARVHDDAVAALEEEQKADMLAELRAMGFEV